MYKCACYVADGTKGASRGIGLRSPESSASTSRRFVYYAQRSCRHWCHLHDVPRSRERRRVGSKAQQLGQGRIREEPLTNG